MIEELEQLNDDLEKTIHNLQVKNERLNNELQVQIEDNTRLNEYIEEQDKKLQQLENIIKEVREYIETKMSIRKNCESVYSYDIRNDDYIKQCNKLLEILDKVDKE